MNRTPSLNTLKKNVPAKHHAQLAAVYRYGQRHLKDLQRRGGESYFQHGVEVAMTLKELTDDWALLAAAILHDLHVHPYYEKVLEKAPLKPFQKKIIGGMQQLRRLHIDEKTDDLDLVIKNFTRDGRLLILRMAHRLNDVRHIDRFKGVLKKAIARETLHMYSAIAGRLGLHKWRREMEDICFELLHPRTFIKMKEKFKDVEKTDKSTIKHSKKFILDKFKDVGIDGEVHNRIKGYYSTYRKMTIKNRPFEQIYDRLAIRILVESEEQCYRVLGIIHKHMHPIHGKLKDFIASPKNNGYRSIHTVVYPLPGVNEKPVEIQIRTQQMHQECEFGIASHSNYKIVNYVLSKPIARVNLFRNLENLHAEIKSPKQFEKALRTYFRSDHMVIFDSKNNLYHLKKPATAMDFACLAYGKKIKKIKEVYINGKEQHFRTPLEDGDIVEVKFTTKPILKKSHTGMCYHPSAKNLIKRVLGKK